MEPTATQTEIKAPKQVSNGEVMINMESMIKSYYTSNQNLKEELKKVSDMLKDMFEQDSTYAAHKQANDDTKKILQQTKSEISKKVQVMELAEKVKGMKAELKENKSAISDYLAEYARMSGATEIEMDDGQMLEIKTDYKLVNKQMRLF